jgi:tetratricopeptide (TPR) repeat protein
VSGAFSDVDEATWLQARIAPLVGAETDGASAGREESFTAWRRFLEEMAATRPCVLVVEDLHWADDALLEFLEELLDWSAPVPLFLLCTARPELFERRPLWGGGKRNATTISLSPLTRDDASRLLQALLERSVLPAETQALLLDRTGGNPLYAEQFARMLAEREGLENVSVPETVHALVAARLDTLRPELKSLLHDAAVVGRVFWTGAAAALAQRPRDDVRRDLNELVRREFVRPVRASSIEGEDELSFWHALVRDVAYQQIPRSPRADKHVAAARWFEEVARDAVEDHAAILAYHYGESNRLDLAAGVARADVQKSLMHAVLLAGDRALQLDAEAAEAYFRRALELAGDRPAERATAQARLASALGIRGDAADAVKAYEEAIPVLRETDEVAAAAALRRLSSATWALGNAERSDAAAREAISMLQNHPGPELIRAYGTAALNAAIAGRYDEAEELYEEGFERAGELGVEDVGILLHARASVRGYRGDPECIADMREAVELGRRLGLGRDTAISMNNLADTESWYVGLRQARETWDEAIEFSRGRGINAAVMWQRGERLRALYHGGEWDDALADATELLAWDLERGGGPLEVYAQLPLAGINVHRGNVGEAQAHVDALVRAARKSGDPQVVVPALAMAALVASATDDVTGAVEHLTELERITAGEPAWRAYCQVEPTRIALAASQRPLAEKFLDNIEFVPGWGRCARPTARAALAEAAGDLETATSCYREAARCWEEYGSVLEQAYALLGLGRCGDVAAAREADDVFGRLDARPVLARAA